MSTINFLAEDRPHLNAHNNGALIDDNTKDDRFEITLSVSTKTVRTREDGEDAKSFNLLTFDSADIDALNGIVTSHVYSTNVWNGACNDASYVGMTGVTLDIDGEMTIEQAKAKWGDVNYILHSSAHHLAEKNGKVAERFRIILLLPPGKLHFTTVAEHAKVYAKMLALCPEMDPKCINPGRKFFPFTPDKHGQFVWLINVTGRFIDIDIADVPDMVAKPKALLTYQPTTELNTQEELERMLKFDKFIPWCQEHAADGLPEPLWYHMISNLCRFEGGGELIHQISAADPTPGRYDFHETEDKIQHALESSGPVGYEEIARCGWPGKVLENPFAPAGWAKIGRIKDRKPLFPTDKGTPDIHLSHDDRVIVDVADIWTLQDFSEIKRMVREEDAQLRAVCPFCDDENASVRANAFHFVYLYCGKCNRSYYCTSSA